MLLQDFDFNRDTKLGKINSFLRENFGFTLDSEVSVEDLNNIKSDIKKNVMTLKIKENMSPKDPELVKQLLMLEGVNLLISGKKQLNESGSVGPASRVYTKVIDNLANFVVQNVEVGDDEEEAIKHAMKHYRSSKYRFPDYEIEYDLKNKVQELLPNIGNQLLEPEVDEAYNANLDKTGRDIADPAARERASQFIKAGPKSSSGIDWDNITVDSPQNNHNHDHDGKVSYPHGKQALLRKKGTTQMKENFVKQLRALLESEVEQAEVIIAAKGFSQELQDMIEKVGRLMNEDLPPVSDQMRQAYGQDVAASFQTTMQSELENVLGNLRSTKDKIDASVTSISTGGGMDAETDMDAEIGGGEDFNDMGDMGVDDELGNDVEDLAGDAFGGDIAAAGPEEEPLGRATKESKEADLKRKILETKNLIAQAKRLKSRK
jgi:predicted nucleic-acid-binding protein